MYNEHTDEELIELYDKVANELSYFNAAEGPSWYAESVARSKCQKVYQELVAEFKFRDLELPKGNYLI
jgi:hypothetical protein